MKPGKRRCDAAQGTGLSLDGAISRVSAIKDDSDGNILESYNYLGSDTIVQQNRPQPGVDLTYIQQNGDTLYSTAGGDRYRGLDEFGRVVDQFWTNPNSPTTSTTDRFQFGYDTDNNVLFRNNLVSSSNSELYAYDSNNRLTSFQRGTLNAGHNAIVGTPSVNETWSLDALGNWTGGSQARTFNAQNQITGISGTTSTPTYDNNGNMTYDQNGVNYTYDAWNRLVEISTGTQIERLSYDADGRLIKTSYPCGGPVTDSYYSSQWQDVEDDQNAGGVVTRRTYVWGQRNQDELVARDEKVGTGATTRIYAQQDPQNSITTLVDIGGTVQQRFQYDSYGAASVLSASWASTTDSFNWIWRWEGGRFDSVSGDDLIRNRVFNPILGVWMQRDPLGYANGGNRYQADVSNPISYNDPYGTTASDVADGAFLGWGALGATETFVEGGLVLGPAGWVLIGAGATVVIGFGIFEYLSHLPHHGALLLGPEPVVQPLRFNIESEGEPAEEKPDLKEPGTQRNPDGTPKNPIDQVKQLQDAKDKGHFIECPEKSNQNLKNRLNQPYDPDDWDQ